MTRAGGIGRVPERVHDSARLGHHVPGTHLHHLVADEEHELPFRDVGAFILAGMRVRMDQHARRDDALHDEQMTTQAGAVHLVGHSETRHGVTLASTDGDPFGRR